MISKVIGKVAQARLAIKRAQEADGKIKVFLDDDTAAPERQKDFRGYDVWVTTPEEAIALLRKGNVSHISLDHDLGLEPDTRNGYMVAAWIEQAAAEGSIPRLMWRCHSRNPVGKDNMRAALTSADRFWDRREE